jgi:Flp pilus assembly protein TadG
MELVYNVRPFGEQQSRRGNWRMTLAAALLIGVPMAGALGYGIDHLRGYAVQAKLSQAVDAAALAGGRVMFDDQRNGHIKTFFEAALPKGFLGCYTADLSIAEDQQAGTLTVSGRAKVQATFLRLFGYDDLTVEASSMVQRNGKTGRLTL